MSPEQLFDASYPVARKMAQKLHSHQAHRFGVEVEDLEQVGLVAVWNAAKSFDASRGISFSTYFWPRLRGAMIDLIRKARGRGYRYGVEVELTDHAVSTVGGDILTRESVRDSMRKMSRQQRRVLAGIARGERSVDIARRFRISESRVCQVRSRIADIMRASV